MTAPRRSAVPDAADLAAWWDAFVRGRDPALRERLIHAYQEFARIMAAKLYARRVYTEMEFADYLQYATVGLIEAVDRFEPGRGNKFETYAASRINGAVLSGIEQSTEIQQQISARRRVIRERLVSLSEASAAAPADDVFARLAELAIGLAVGFALDDTGMHQADGAEYADNSYRGVELKQLKARILALVEDLPQSQKAVVRGHYLQQQPFADIAAALRLSRGRVAQLHKEALGNLRARMMAMNEVDLSC